MSNYPPASALPSQVVQIDDRSKKFLKVNRDGAYIPGFPDKKQSIIPYDEDLPSDIQAIYVGGSGNISVKCPVSQVILQYLAVPAGAFLPGPFLQVTTATTATNLIGYYYNNAIAYTDRVTADGESRTYADGTLAILID